MCPPSPSPKNEGFGPRFVSFDSRTQATCVLLASVPLGTRCERVPWECQWWLSSDPPPLVIPKTHPCVFSGNFSLVYDGRHEH